MSDAVASRDVASFVASVRARSPSIEIQTSELAPFALDGVSPAALVRVASSDDVGGVLAEAQGAGLAVVPRGGGRHVAANTPTRYDVALCLAGVWLGYSLGSAWIRVTAKSWPSTHIFPRYRYLMFRLGLTSRTYWLPLGVRSVCRYLKS